MPSRITSEVLNLRHTFTTEERLALGDELAQCRQHETEIAEEMKSSAAGFNERKAKLAATVGSLSRKISDGFDMQNIQCALRYDDPNVGEVSFYDGDKLVKTRAMTLTERQMDLPLDQPKTQDEVDASIAKSAANVEGFFPDKAEGTEGAVADEPAAAEESTSDEPAEEAAAENLDADPAPAGNPADEFIEPAEAQPVSTEKKAKQTAPTSLRKPNRKQMMH
jgi:hypothetical protein